MSATQHNHAGRRQFLRKFAKIAGWVTVAAAAAGASVLYFLEPTPVASLRPQRGPITAEVFGTGTLESKIVVGISSKMIGKVAEVLVDQGDTVVAGQAVARLESKDYEDAVRVAEAKLRQVEAELNKARLDFERVRALVRKQISPQADLDTAQAEFAVAEARVKNARAELGVAQARLADTRIVSPIAGLVITRNLEAGSTVVPGAPIFRVADTSALWVHAQVDERETGRLVAGQPARVVFRATPDRPLRGRLVRLAQEADRVTEEREVDVAVEQLPPNFFIGQKADVFIETARKDHALQLPKHAVVARGGAPGVFVVTDGRAQWREVTLGLVGRETVEIVGGLAETDAVVAEPSVGRKPLADGQRVVAASAKPGGAS